MYKELFKLNNRKANNIINNEQEALNRHFTKDYIQMENKHKKDTQARLVGSMVEH